MTDDGGVLQDGNRLGGGDNPGPAYLPSSSSLNKSGEITSTGNITTTTDDSQGRSPEPDPEYQLDENGRTCGFMPRVIKGQLLGTEDGWSVDFYMNPCTMLLSILIIWSFVIWCAADDNAGDEIGEWQEWIVQYWTWFYVFGFVVFGIFTCYLLFSRFGDIKLGPKDEPPRFSVGSWFAMLFSAGVGVGLYFYGVAEPIWMYYGAKFGENRYYTNGDNLEHGLDAMNQSWFHWGLTASSCYCVVGLPLAYFTHVKNAPLKFSSAFVPLLGRKYADGFIGDLIDTFAVVGTMFGVSTSLGLGVIQLNAFLHFMDPDTFDDEDTDLRLIIIWIITCFATISVFTGLDVGIRRLSEGNFAFCLILLFYLFVICDPFYLTNLFIQTVGYHINNIFTLTTFTDAFQQAGFVDVDNYELFMSWWTIFYWGWWIAWSPFVGIFIAQISRGRTIREFILGNVLVPTLFTSIWLCIFGGVGIYMQLAFDGQNGNAWNNVYYDHINTANNQSIGISMDMLTGEDLGYDNMTDIRYVQVGICDDKRLYYDEYKGNKVAYLECFPTATMLFEMIDRFPLGGMMNVLAGVGIITYFVTSSDSASHVIDVLTANGNEEPPKLQRIFWAFSEGAVASVLLSVGGSDALSALQTVSIASGLPFCAIMLSLCYAFIYALRVDMGEIDPDSRTQFSLDFWDATNPEITNQQLVLWCCKGFWIPCVQHYQNYNTLVELDRNNRVFGSSTASRIMWTFLLIVPSLLVFIFCMLGLAFNGWAHVALVLYVFVFGIGAWQRSRIRSYYGIDGNPLCDVCAHFLCCGAFAIAQEANQIYNAGQPSSPRHVADRSGVDVELMAQDNDKPAPGAVKVTSPAEELEQSPGDAGGYAD